MVFENCSGCGYIRCTDDYKYCMLCLLGDICTNCINPNTSTGDNYVCYKCLWNASDEDFKKEWGDIDLSFIYEMREKIPSKKDVDEKKNKRIKY